MRNEIRKIINENERRNSLMFAPFNPITGEGSTGERVPLAIADFPIPLQHVPPAVAENPLAVELAANGVGGFLSSRSIEDTPENRDMVVDAMVRLRCLHDFAFWAATFVYIQNKQGGEDVLFRLTYPQRRFVEFLESQRLADRPIRVILLKARQWGGSTTTQLYMAWLQLVHQKGLNSLIATHVLKASANIKEMFRRMIERYPASMLAPHGQPADTKSPKLSWLGGSDSTQILHQRNCTISVGSAQVPDSVRSGNYSLVHLSEVGLWKTTEGRKPEDIVRSACSGVLYRPYTMIVYESTANGVGNFFHNEYVAAKDPNVPSQFAPFFVSWFDIELYRQEFASEQERIAFAENLFDSREGAAAASDRQEPGQYLWWLWQKGASLEGIRWYVSERAKYHDHGSIASEFPSDDIEAFVNSGASVFDQYQVERLRPTCRAPRFTGEVYGDALEGKAALQGLTFSHDRQGLLSVWALPDPVLPTDTETVSNRYLAVVDVGGRSDKADFSVIVVFDRLGMIDGEKPAVVAQWYGHIDMDLLAWKAAQIAAFYSNALLVIESNTLETHDRDRNVDGDQSQAILNQIKDVYPNLYARPQSEDAILQGLPLRYGFHTNTLTKPLVISMLVKAIREGLYIERDSRCIDEYRVYERKPNGSFGAQAGRHDDLLMTRAIGLHICFRDMPLPQIVPISASAKRYVPKIVSAASF